MAVTLKLRHYLLAQESTARAEAGDARDKSAITDEILLEVELPDLRAINERIARMGYWRQRMAENSAA